MPVHPEEIPVLGKEDYEGRMARLWEMPQAEGYDTIVIYGDREHFSNVDYFTGYDARWEETLLILPRHGRPGILVGNEGIGYVKRCRWRLMLNSSRPSASWGSQMTGARA